MQSKKHEGIVCAIVVLYALLQRTSLRAGCWFSRGKYSDRERSKENIIKAKVDMDEKNSAVNEKMNGERRQSKQCVTPSLDALDEIKKFKENLLQSVSHGGERVISDSIAEPPLRSRSRSASKAWDALVVPSSVLADMDDDKLFELKEAFLLFDMDGDGCIDHSDLRATLVSLGERVDDHAVASMLAEAPNPLDFEGFVNLLGYRTLELDSEETMVQALSRWDYDGNGYISEERLRHDLMTWGDRFTKKETDYALDEAPVIQKGSVTMIDYVKFCNQLCGLRKRSKNDK